MTAEHHRRLQMPFDGRNFVFAIIATSILAAKTFRIYSHSSAISTFETIIWSASFYAQDLLFLLSLRFLFSKINPSSQRLRYGVTAVAFLAASALLLMAAATISVFLVTGSEIHWQHIGVLNDSSGSKMMFSAGFKTFAVVLVSLLLPSWFARRIYFDVAGAAVDVVTELFNLVLELAKHRSCNRYEKIISLEDGDEFIDRDGSNFSGTTIFRIAIGLVLLLQMALAFVHSDDQRLSSLSWTLPLTPFTEPSHSSAQLNDLPGSHANSFESLASDGGFLNSTALTDPVQLSWLPKEVQVPGFEDWYTEGGQHYNSSADPLKVSNLDNELYPALQKQIADIKIRHVVLLVLESTRSDVFPILNATSIRNRLAEAHSDKKLTTEEVEKLANLTNTARFLAGIPTNTTQQPRTTGGSIRAHNAFTTASYTLKSLVGTLCGIAPMTVDFDSEVSHHVYQPCLAQIFEAFNLLDHGNRTDGTNFTSFNWKSLFMQSVTGEYDKQSALMPKTGYTNETFITKEYLKSPDAKFGPEDAPDINYYGMPEVVLEEYVRDAFSTANKNDERLFLTHLTSTSHHPFKTPAAAAADAAKASSSKRSLDDLSAYLDAIGYVDRWISKIMDIMDEQGVTDETLLVLVGDHGISLPEDDAITPYENPNVGNFRVPLLFHHPKLPHIDITDAVISSQILPTVLDLLLETKSLSEPEGRAAQDLVRNYEGQSLLRPMNKVSQSGQGDWQFTVSNPGGTMVSVRDARQPRWRLVVPIAADAAWRFTDLDTDPYEKKPLEAHSYKKLLTGVKVMHGAERAEWVEEAALVTRWWVEENRRRWQYDP
ncbi:hypothetical protein TruAng_009129 [Truncatella angustata]|nr:hypothetical protein TruAng_009129 [Truncatella angustata]